MQANDLSVIHPLAPALSSFVPAHVAFAFMVRRTHKGQVLLRIDPAQAKEIVLQKRAAGVPVKDAMQSVGRSYETWRDWRKTDLDFKARSDRIRDRLGRGETEKSPVPDFPEFAEKFLFQPLHEHQLRAWDVLSGREPSDFWMLDDDGDRVQRWPLMQYQPGSEGTDQVILNFPPNHGKSATWTMNWVTWLINRDPSIRIIIVSKTQRLAKQFLLGVKQRLTHPKYEAMHVAFAPEGGWRSDDKADGLAWREEMIYVKGRDPSEKDPTVQALGIGGQIYGTRADLVILDDCEDLANYGSYEAHANWVAQEVSSRLEPEVADEPPGRLVILGTRVGPMDMYRYLRDNAKTLDDEPTYTYFSQPAILEGVNSPEWETWRVLWPERMTAKVLRKKRAAFANPRHFQLIYQQNDVPDEATFPAEAVNASINRQRFYGPMTPGATGHRLEGMHGLYTIGSWDPASSSGYNAMIVLGTDRMTKRVWVLDIWNKKGVFPEQSIQRLKDLTVKYDIKEWRIEKNGVQQFIAMLPEIQMFLRDRGAKLMPHETRQNKFDPSYGVEGLLQPLFLSCVKILDDKMVPLPDGKGQIELPSPRNCPGVGTLVEQLTTWEPDNKKQVQDLVMALWFGVLAARAYTRGGMGQQNHIASRFTPRKDVARRGVHTFERFHAA